MAVAEGVDAAAVAKRANEAGLRLVRFLWCGNDGTVRAKASSMHGLEGRIRAGIGLTVAMQAMNGLDHLQSVEAMGPVGEIRLVPDPDTFRVLPYAPHSGAMLVDQRTLDGDVAPVDQRGFLRRMSDRLAERGARLQVAFENEFALAIRADDGSFRPTDSSLCFSTIGMAAAQDYVDALVEALDAQAIPLEQYYAELGHGQQEISTVHRPAVQAADEQVLVRETIRGVAGQRGLVATLAPKPWPGGAGNGGHIHFSLWDVEDDRNRFHDPDAPDRFSAEGRAFLAGVLEHLPGLCGLTAPSFNSYHRIVPQYWAGAFTCWGHDNREAPLRLPSLFWGMEEASTNVELKAADEQLLVRETIRGVAAQRGLAATLAPKPWPGGAGNGGHIHFSLWDAEDDRNRFHDPEAPDRFSAEGRAFLAGVLEHLPGLCGLTAPSFNSYHRIVPQYWAGAFTCWGHDNREAPLRLPSLFWGMEEASTNVELKAADATANPYLAVGGVIAAGLDGLDRGLEPPDPVEDDPATIPEGERERLGIRRLPSTQEEALDRLEADDVLTDALGPVLARSYLTVRRSEWEAYSAEDEAFEQQGHFLKY